VTNSNSPIKSVNDLVAYAKNSTTVISYASSGNGSTAHLSGSLLSAETGIKAEHVPYKAIGQGLIDLLSGQITLMFYPYSALLPHIQSGKLRVLAVTSEKRTSYLPQVPTMVEAGYPNILLKSWFAIYAPAGTPRKSIDIFYSAMEKAATDPDVLKSMANIGTDVYLAGPDEMARFGQSEINRYQKIVLQAGARAD
jgi:tripartite-type tricarboxylate transporter receptor subunit TctC